LAPPLPTAFVSYSRDDKEFARKLAADLKAARAPVWLDQLDIPPGRPWDIEVEDALTASPRMLVILSPSSAKSSPVRNEISFAQESGKTIIPVLYKDCVVPLQLRRIQYIDFRTDYGCALETLLTHLAIPADAEKVTRDETADEAEREAERLTQAEQHRAEHDAEMQLLRDESERLKREAEALRTEAAERQVRDAEMQRLKEESERLRQEADRLRKEAAEREAAEAKSREAVEPQRTRAPERIPAPEPPVTVPKPAKANPWNSAAPILAPAKEVPPELPKTVQANSSAPWKPPAAPTSPAQPWKPAPATAKPERLPYEVLLDDINNHPARMVGRGLKGLGLGVLYIAGIALFGFLIFVGYRLVTGGLGLLTSGSYLAGLGLLAAGALILIVINKLNR
jgi:hypothetical protein